MDCFNERLKTAQYLFDKPNPVRGSNFRTWGVEAGVSGVPWLLCKAEASLGYMRPTHRANAH